jgi:hypothetical protein
VRGLYSSTPRLQRCAASLSPDTPVAVGFARWTSGRYHAAPSAFFVYRLASGKGEVFVVDPSCSGGSVRTFVNNVQLP